MERPTRYPIFYSVDPTRMEELQQALATAVGRIYPDKVVQSFAKGIRPAFDPPFVSSDFVLIQGQLEELPNVRTASSTEEVVAAEEFLAKISQLHRYDPKTCEIAIDAAREL